MKTAPLIVAAALLFACGAPRTRITRVDPWTLKAEQTIEVLDSDRRLALRVSSDGRIWEWDATPEKVVTSLLGELGKCVNGFQAYQNQVRAAIEAAKAPKKPAAAPKPAKAPEPKAASKEAKP